MNGIANLRLEEIAIKHPSPSQGYLAAARYFFAGVRTLSQGGPDVALACTFLAAQALECALKAYLSNGFYTKKELKRLKERGIRHNLVKLWRDAADKGLAVSLQPPVWCVILNKTHDEPYYLRYPIGANGLGIPSFSVMVPELSKVIDLVGSIVN